jgi:hypothetical protein
LNELMSNLSDLSGEQADPAASLNPNTNPTVDPSVDSGSELGLQKDLAALSQLVRSAAHHCQDNPQDLLSLLRLLESLHRQIREEKFLAILPSNRQALYSLLRDIEREGGWPYIPGISLRILLQHMDEQAAKER